MLIQPLKAHHIQMMWSVAIKATHHFVRYSEVLQGTEGFKTAQSLIWKAGNQDQELLEHEGETTWA